MPSTTKKTVNINSSEHKALEQKLDKLSRLVESSASAPINEVESVFQYLDTRRIPASDKPTAKDECAVDLALWALLVVSACEGHLKKSRALDPALTKAWPRIWKWLEFLHIQCCQKSVFGGSFKIRALSMIPNTLMVLGRSNVLRRLATSTAGVITMVAKYWLGEGINAGVEGFFKVAGMARPFTNALDSLLDAEDLMPDRLADVVAAAPGGAKMVARVAIQHLSDVSSFKQPDFETVYAHLSLINNLSCNSYPSLHLALLNRGMIPAMVKMLVFCNMQPMDNVRIAGCVMMCYFTFIDALMTVNGPSWVVQAFDSGILPALLKSGRRLTQLDAHRRNLCTKLLSDLLCQYLVYRSVLRPIAKALRRTERLQIDEDVAGPLWDGWLLFKSLAEERIAIKDERDDEVQRKCNRVGCDETDETSDLSRCSGCLSVLYCENNCQRLDWPAHRPMCQEMQHALREGIFTPVSASENNFLASVVIKDVWAHAQKLIDYVDSSNMTTSVSLLAMNLDYTKVPVTVTVKPASDLLGIDGGWDAMIQQARESGQFIVTRAEVQRGGVEAAVMNLVPVPIHKR